MPRIAGKDAGARSGTTAFQSLEAPEPAGLPKKNETEKNSELKDSDEEKDKWVPPLAERAKEGNGYRPAIEAIPSVLKVLASAGKDLESELMRDFAAGMNAVKQKCAQSKISQEEPAKQSAAIAGLP